MAQACALLHLATYRFFNRTRIIYRLWALTCLRIYIWREFICIFQIVAVGQQGCNVVSVHDIQQARENDESMMFWLFVTRYSLATGGVHITWCTCHGGLYFTMRMLQLVYIVLNKNTRFKFSGVIAWKWLVWQRSFVWSQPARSIYHLFIHPLYYTTMSQCNL